MFGILGKIFGGMIFFLGLLISIFFPYVIHKDFQPEALGNAGILLGIIMIGVGLYLILS